MDCEMNEILFVRSLEDPHNVQRIALRLADDDTHLQLEVLQHLRHKYCMNAESRSAIGSYPALDALRSIGEEGHIGDTFRLLACTATFPQQVLHGRLAMNLLFP